MGSFDGEIMWCDEECGVLDREKDAGGLKQHTDILKDWAMRGSFEESVESLLTGRAEEKWLTAQVNVCVVDVKGEKPDQSMTAGTAKFPSLQYAQVPSRVPARGPGPLSRARDRCEPAAPDPGPRSGP